MGVLSLTEVRATITATGDVQKVGFRYRVEVIARKLGLKGYTDNLPDGTVKIVCEGSRKAIEEFAKAIKIRDPPINVEGLKLEFSGPSGEFKAFNIKYGKLEEELAEGLGAGIAHLTRLRRDVWDLRYDVRTGFTSLRSDMKAEFTSLRSDIKTEFTSLRSDMKTELASLRSEIRESFSLVDKRYGGISETLKGLASDFRKLVKAYLSRREVDAKP